MTNPVAPEYIALIEDWAKTRNFFTGATAYGQFFKLVSELGEWAAGSLMDDRDEVIDGLGDAYVVTTIMARQLGSDVETLRKAAGFSRLPACDFALLPIIGLLGDNLAKNQTEEAQQQIGNLADALVKTATRYGLDINVCLSRAYSDIKDRVGVMYNGVYIKSTDPRYPGVIEELKGGEQAKPVASE